ncbi:MAG: hypothetical protein V1835_01640 [Candidatus Micrarchaeota archaeon]
MGRYRAQASFFDGIMFMLIVVFSVSLVFVNLNTYAVAQDKVMRTAYLSNYLQSVAKVAYFLDVSTLKDVRGYCADAEFSKGAGSFYCREANGVNLGTKYNMDCDSLKEYKGHISVADLVKKDIDPSDDSGYFDDKFGDSRQMGRTALRCAMKEIMKPFSFSGYRYITEVAEASTSSDNVRYAADEKYASDFMFTNTFQNSAPAYPYRNDFGCEKVNSDQLLVIRTPFKILMMEDGQFQAEPYVLRTCLWPSMDIVSSP